MCYTADMKKIKLRKKIFILYTVLLCCSAALVFALLYRYTVKILTHKYTDSVTDIVQRTTRQMEAAAPIRVEGEAIGFRFDVSD